VVREDDETPVTHRAEGEAYRDRLADKLTEEAAEYAESRDVEELADVLEVVAALRESPRRGRRGTGGTACGEGRRTGRVRGGVVLERVEE